MKPVALAALAAFCFSGAVGAQTAGQKGPHVTEFNGEMSRNALQAARSGCALVSYKLNADGDVYGVHVLKTSGHRDYKRIAEKAVRSMEVAQGSAPKGTYDAVIQFIVTRPGANNAEVISDMLPEAENACPYKAKTDHETLVISGERIAFTPLSKCEQASANSNLKVC